MVEDASKLYSCVDKLVLVVHFLPSHTRAVGEKMPNSTFQNRAAFPCSSVTSSTYQFKLPSFDTGE
jgi:hypothetical protein